MNCFVHKQLELQEYFLCKQMQQNIFASILYIFLKIYSSFVLGLRYTEGENLSKVLTICNKAEVVHC